jgi:elongation factor P hydroxylase
MGPKNKFRWLSRRYRGKRKYLEKSIAEATNRYLDILTEFYGSPQINCTNWPHSPSCG